MPGEPLANPEAEFKIALEEYVRLNRNDTAKPIRFNLDIYHAKQERAGNAIRATVHWDGDNLIVDSDHYVYVSTPHRAFVLHRDSRDLPLSIRALSPVSDSKREANEIIKFDLKVEGGYMAAFRPTGLKLYQCGYGEFVAGDPRRVGWIVSGSRLSDGRLAFEFRGSGDGKDYPIEQIGSFTVDPQRGCSVVEGQMYNKWKVDAASNIGASQFEYYPPSDGLPQLIKSYKHQESFPKSKNSTPQHQQFYYSDYVVEPMPKEKLTLEYYGLPDPLKSKTKWWGWPTALIAAGVVALIVFFVIRRRRRALT